MQNIEPLWHSRDYLAESLTESLVEMIL